MAKTDGPMVLVVQAARELGLLNRQLADLMGVNKRTVQRWLLTGFGPISFHLQRVAEAVWPTNPDLARQLAAQAGTTLEAWGLVPAPAPVEAAPPPTPPPAPLATAASLLSARQEHADSIVYDAANAVNLPPRAVLPAVAAAFRRALALGVDIGSLVQLWEPEREKPKG